jgi:sugar/nucleoside kinase (ribokinase family)
VTAGAGVPDVVVAGPVSWNEIVHLDALPDAVPHTVFARGSYRTVGGTSAGKALNLAALGRRVLLRTVLGDDDAGRSARAALAVPGLELADAPASDGRTERHLNLMGAGSERLSVYLHAPSDVPTTDPGWERTLGALDQAGAVVVDLAPHAQPLLAEAARRGVPVWADVHDWDARSAFHRPWVDAASYLFLSSERLPEYRALMSERVAAGARLVVCTHGADGATALDADGRWYDVDAVPVERVVDTNGAGDGFVAGFLDAHLDGAGVPEALAAAARHAAAVVTSEALAPA